MSTGTPNKPATSESIKKTIDGLASRNVEAFLVESREEALAKLLELVPEGSEVFVNTSETLDAIGYTEYMHGNDRYLNLHDQMIDQPDPAAQREFRRKTTTADYFVGSVQAIAETGEIVIASSSGSQIGAYSYGARRVILVAGTQKICPSLAEAEARTRGFTLERHDRWLEDRGVAPTPIGKYLVMEHEPVVGRISMLLIPESLGW
jgi:L-lactate utilization protein LutB